MNMSYNTKVNKIAQSRALERLKLSYEQKCIRLEFDYETNR